jgi:hypothetical protein
MSDWEKERGGEKIGESEDIPAKKAFVPAATTTAEKTSHDAKLGFV